MPAKEADAQATLTAAEEILAKLEASPGVPERDLLILQASFLARLAAGLLLDPDFPALPAGFERQLDLDRARNATRLLARNRGRYYRSYSRQPTGTELDEPKRGSPPTDADREIADMTAATVADLRMARLDLFREYLLLPNSARPSEDPEVISALLGLLAEHWSSHGRLPEIVDENAVKLSRRRSRSILKQLHPPNWKRDVSCELWESFDERFLYWSDPLPDPEPLSQES